MCELCAKNRKFWIAFISKSLTQKMLLKKRRHARHLNVSRKSSLWVIGNSRGVKVHINILNNYREIRITFMLFLLVIDLNDTSCSQTAS